jgi:DNA-binding GntR family transcriptional regulator
MRGPVVTNKPKYRALADSIIERIRSGEFPPGSKIPSMRDLRSEETGGERTVHEAIRLLTAEGWVTTAVGRGTFVVDQLPTRTRSAEERIAELEAQLEALRQQAADSAELREQVAHLQVALTELYAKTGHAYPAAKSARGRRRTAS